MADLPTVNGKKVEDIVGTLEKWRQRLIRVLPDETDIVKAPINTRFEVIDQFNLRFLFDPAPTADGYEVHWGTDPEFKKKKGAVLDNEVLDVEVPIHNEFSCNTKYYFRVRSTKNGTKSVWSPTAVFGFPVPGALLEFFGDHAVDNVVDENTIINLKIVLPRTATLGGNTIIDDEAIWVDHVVVEADWSALDGAITDSATTMDVTAGQGSYFKSSGFYKIEDEIILVNSVATDTVTIQRGVLGTTPAAHADLTTIRFHARLLREQFSGAENGTYSVVLTIPNPEKVRTRDFEATPYNRCGEAGPQSTTQVTLALPGTISDLAADPRFQKVILTWSELPLSAYRYQVYVSNTAPVPINDADPTLTAGVTKLAIPLADHEGVHEFVHEVVYAAGTVWYYGVRAIDILGGVGGGDTVGPLQPDQFATQAAPDVENVSATEGPAGLPRGTSARARVVMQSSVTCGFDPPSALNDPDGLFKTCKIYVQPVGVQTLLDGAIGSGDTTITVDAGGVQKLGGWTHYLIDSEIIQITSYDFVNNQVTVVRGADGTTAAAHADNAQITPSVAPLFTQAEGPTAPLRFVWWPMGDASVYFVSVSQDGVENQVLSSPSVSITMDAQASAPLEVQNLRGLKTIHGGKIFWDEGLEPDLDHYEIADLGSRTLVAQADILDQHVIAQVPALPGNENKVIWDWIETLYRGQVTTGSATITLFGDELREDQFDPIGIGPVKETLQFVTSTDTDVSDTSYDIDDTNKSGVPPNEVSTIVLNSIPSEASANSTVEFYIGGRAHKFYVRAVNQSGLQSEWRPIEGTFLELSATAPDGSFDIGVPSMHIESPVVFGGTFWSPGWIMDDAGLSSTPKPGKLVVHVYARSFDTGVDADADFDVDLKQNIGGITDVEISVQHSDDGSTGLVTDVFNFPVEKPEKGDYTLHSPVIGNDVWKVNLGRFEIDMPSQGIPRTTGVTVRVKNYWGWSSSIAAQSFGGSSSVEFIGPAAVQPETDETVVANEVFPDLGKTASKTVNNLSADVTIKQPQYTSTIKGKGGEIFTITREQVGTAYDVAFDSNYIGLDGKPCYMELGFYTTWTFQVVTATKIRCIGYIVGEL